MLVLSRKINESIKIGNDIELVVTKISGNKVSIGIRAPNDVRILRSEIDENPRTGDAVTVSQRSLSSQVAVAK